MRALVLSLLLIGGPAGAAPPPPLTASGWGALRIGMRETAAVRRFQLKDQDPEGEVTGPECREYLMPANSQLVVMTQDGRVTRISLHEKGAVRTDRGLGVGATETQVRKAYGAALRAEPHHYEGLPARYLTWWATPKTRGIRYETNVRRVVTAIHAGDASIQLIEGCL